MQISNTHPYKVVNRPNAGNLAIAAGIQLPTTETDANLVESPDGRYLIGSYGDGSIRVLQADPSQSGFLTELQVLTPAQTGLTGITPMAFTPDCLKLYVVNGTGVDAYDVNGGTSALAVPPTPILEYLEGLLRS